MRESKIESELVRQVRAAGGDALKFVSPGRVGVPDRLVVMPGGVCSFVECKAPGKRPTAAQSREHNRLAALGVPVHVVDSFESVCDAVAELRAEVVRGDAS